MDRQSSHTSFTNSPEKNLKKKSGKGTTARYRTLHARNSFNLDEGSSSVPVYGLADLNYAYDGEGHKKLNHMVQLMEHQSSNTQFPDRLQKSFKNKTKQGFKTFDRKSSLHSDGESSMSSSSLTPYYDTMLHFRETSKLEYFHQNINLNPAYDATRYRNAYKVEQAIVHHQPSADAYHASSSLNYDRGPSTETSPVYGIANLNYAYSQGKILEMLQSDAKEITWNCRKCLYANALHINACEKCKEVRTGLVGSAYALLNSPSTSLQKGHSQEIDDDNTLVGDQTWTCTTCTLINNSNSLSCEACCVSKLQLLSISDSVTPQKNYTALKYKQKNSNRSKRLKNRLINDAEDTSSSIPCFSNNTKDWICILCTYQNTISEFICDMCKTIRNKDITIQLSQEEIAELQWNYIVSNCKVNKKLYIDESFPPVPTSLYYLPAENNSEDIKWRRMRNVVVDDIDTHLPWVVFKNLLEPLDVCQGVLGDCWFLSALSVLVEREDLVRAIILTKHLCPQGVYQVRLCKDGNWTMVTVDDIFPCDQEGYLLHAQAIRKQLWVPLIEKAFAKMNDCYESLTCGSVIEGLSTLTGAPCENIPLQPTNPSDISNPDLIWAQLVSSRKALFLMGTLCGGTDVKVNESDFEKKGLHPNHIYSILDLLCVGKHRVLQLRDPYGEYGSSYTSIWAPQLQGKLPFREPQNGVFWIDFEEVLKYFSCVGICKIRNGWCETRLSGNFYLSTSQQELSCVWLTVHETTEIDIILYQNSQRETETSKRTCTDLCVVIFKHKDDSSITYNLVTNSKRGILGFVGCYKVLEPAQYLIIPLTFKHWHLKQHPKTDTKYVLAVHSSKKISAESVTALPQALADAVISLALINGQCEELLQHFNVYYLTKAFFGVAIVAENNYKYKWVHLKCNGEEESSNVVSTRGLKNTMDSIPPLHRQVIAVFTKFKGNDKFFTAHQLEYRISNSSELNDWGGTAGVQHIPDIDYQTDGLHLPRLIQD